MWTPRLDLTRKPRFLALTEALAEDIRSGRLQPGERLPTQRHLARELDMAVATVSRAYTEAQRAGLVQGETGRGTFVRGRSADLEFGLLEGEGAPRLELGLDLPLYGLDPDLAQALAKLARRGDLQSLLRYQVPEGMAHHRQAGCEWFARHGLTTTPDRVLVCSGAQHALNVILGAITRPGDVVLTEALTYPGIVGVAENLHIELTGVAMDEEGLSPDAFDQACRRGSLKALYTIPTLQNPTTATMSAERRRRIAEIARRHDVAIVEDEVQRLLADNAPPPITSFAPERSYAIAGLSKSVAGGLRVAFASVPPERVEAVAHRIWATSWMISPLLAELACAWIEDGTAERTVRAKREESAARQALARKILGAFDLRMGPFGYSAWLPLPEPWDGARLALEARLRGVAVTPAHVFAIDAAQAPSAVRLSLCAAADRESLRQGLETLADLLAGTPRAGAHVL
jgi:DNA-binding transcriptional MocR family regulator